MRRILEGSAWHLCAPATLANIGFSSSRALGQLRQCLKPLSVLYLLGGAARIIVSNSSGNGFMRR